ncbi:MAG TPA: gamma-glutamyl-gamma-aminobutyrate hydrolase family protein [Pyrinomonadaceae bacterium]|nr:gamma-glutamyl-gamma-aminobutyrate hydrolase family protein [Pyrinomonadaceae bacterium]
MRLEIETRRFYLGRDYSEALAFFGAVPVHIPLIPERDYIENVLKDLDGILLPGSDTDVDPHHFGEDPHPKIKKIVSEKDSTDWLVLEYAEKFNLPVLAICFGMQILNVYRGGSLIQDIESQIENPLKHEQGMPLERNSHRINVENSSKMAKLLAHIDDKPDIKVNSHHHQAIKNVGRFLFKSAWANDGIIECIEDTRAEKYVLGVQWHPELSYKTDKLSSNIFKDFVLNCSNKRS